jgi:hypothetical protein
MLEIKTAPADGKVRGINVGAITKGPGDTFGATLSFQHKGQGLGQVWVGIGLAYGSLVGHDTPFCYAMQQMSIAVHADWTTMSVNVQGTIPSTVVPSKLIDAQRFISNSQPVIGQQPPNPYGVNNWDDEIYASEAGVPQFQTLTVSNYW